MYTKTIVTSTQHSTRHYQRGSWHAITPLYAYIFIFNKNKIFIVYLISLFFPSFSFIYCGSVHISYSFMVATTCIYRPYILYKLYIGSAYPIYYPVLHCRKVRYMLGRLDIYLNVDEVFSKLGRQHFFSLKGSLDK
jgi:hypothetical protein